MANFPTNPNTNDIHTDASGVKYKYLAVGAWKRVGQPLLFNEDDQSIVLPDDVSLIRSFAHIELVTTAPNNLREVVLTADSSRMFRATGTTPGDWVEVSPGVGDFEFDAQTTKLTITLQDGSKHDVDATPFLADVKTTGAVYNSVTKAIDFTLSDASSFAVPVADLLSVTTDHTITGNGADVPLSIQDEIDARTAITDNLQAGMDGKLPVVGIDGVKIIPDGAPYTLSNHDLGNVIHAPSFPPHVDLIDVTVDGRVIIKARQTPTTIDTGTTTRTMLNGEALEFVRSDGEWSILSPTAYELYNKMPAVGINGFNYIPNTYNVANSDLGHVLRLSGLGFVVLGNVTADGRVIIRASADNEAQVVWDDDGATIPAGEAREFVRADDEWAMLSEDGKMPDVGITGVRTIPNNGSYSVTNYDLGSVLIIPSNVAIYLADITEEGRITIKAPSTGLGDVYGGGVDIFIPAGESREFVRAAGTWSMTSAKKWNGGLVYSEIDADGGIITPDVDLDTLDPEQVLNTGQNDLRYGVVQHGSLFIGAGLSDDIILDGSWTDNLPNYTNRVLRIDVDATYASANALNAYTSWTLYVRVKKTSGLRARAGEVKVVNHIVGAFSPATFSVDNIYTLGDKKVTITNSPNGIGKYTYRVSSTEL